MSFGSYLKNQRESKNWTIKELAERLGFSSSYISQLENGTRNPSHKQLATLAKAYQLPEEELKKHWTEGKIQKVSMEGNYKLKMSDVGERRVHEAASKLERGLEELRNTISSDNAYIKTPVIDALSADDLGARLKEAKEFFFLPKNSVPAGHRMFGFRVDGLSLPDAGILAGDFIILDADAKPESGDIVVIAIPDGLVMTYYHERGDYLELRPGAGGKKKDQPSKGEKGSGSARLPRKEVLENGAPHGDP